MRVRDHRGGLSAALAGPDNARRFRTVDVQDLFEDRRRLPVAQLAPGLSVYRRPRMDEEGVPENAEVV